MPRSGRPSGVGRSIGHAACHGSRGIRRTLRHAPQTHTITVPINAALGTERLLEIISPSFKDIPDLDFKQDVFKKLAALKALLIKGFNATNEDELLRLLKSEDKFPIFGNTDDPFREANEIIRSNIALVLEAKGSKKTELINILENILSVAEKDPYFIDIKADTSDPSKPKLAGEISKSYERFIKAYFKACKSTNKEPTPFKTIKPITVESLMTS